MNTAITGCVLPYLRWYPLERMLTSVSKDMRAAAITHTNSRYHLCKDHLKYPLFQRRLWWYRCGWPVRVTLTSADDATSAAGLNVVEILFDGVVGADVYAAAAGLFFVVKSLRGVVLTDETMLHVARFGELSELHCVQVRCRNLRLLACLAKLKHLQVDSFGPDAGAVLDEVTEELPFLCGLQLGSVPPFPRDASYFVRSMSRMALRMLALVPMRSLHYDEHAALCMKWYHGVITMLASFTHNLASDVSSEELPTLAAVCVGPDATLLLAKTVSHVYNSFNDPALSNTLHVHDALVRMAQHATTCESVAATASAITRATVGKHVYATPAMRDAIVSMAPYATTDVAVRCISVAIWNMTLWENKLAAKVFGVACVGDALVRMAGHISTFGTVLEMASVVPTLVKVGKHDFVQSTSLLAAMVTLSAHVAEDYSAKLLAEAMARLLVVVPCTCTTLMSDCRDALVRIAKHASTLESAHWTSLAIAVAARSKLVSFGTPEMRDAFVCMAAYATTDYAVTSVANAIWNITCDDMDAAKLFGVPSVGDALVRMAGHSSTPESVSELASVVCSVVANVRNAPLFVQSSAMVMLSAHATTDESVRWIAEAMTRLLLAEVSSSASVTSDTLSAAVLAMTAYSTGVESAKWLHSLREIVAATQATFTL